MSQKKRHPAALAGAHRGLKTDHAGELISLSNTPTEHSLQSVQTAWLARRYLLSPALARAVASLAFSRGEVRG